MTGYSNAPGTMSGGFAIAFYYRGEHLHCNRQISLRIKRPPSQCLCIEMAACSSIMI